MSEDNEYDWGTKKMKYYQMNKREDNEEENDSDFIEEEKEAIRLQKLRLEKIKKAKLLNEEEESVEENEKINKKLNNKDNNKKNEIKNEISIKPIEIDNKKINENIDLLKNCLEEYKMVDDEIKILSDNKKANVPKTISYLKEYKKINILYSANLLFNILATLNNKMTGHHPSIKYSAMFNYLLTKNSEKNEQIQNNIEKILLYLEKNDKNNKNEENEEEDDINEDEKDLAEGDEEGEEIDDVLDEGNEEMEDFNEEGEDEGEIEDKKKKGKKDNKKEDNKNIYDILIGDPIKKPSFLNKKKKRKKSDKEIIDINNNDSFDKEEDNKNDDDESEDSFIKEQYKSFNKLKKEKELLDIKNKENEKKEIDMKNNFAIRKANKEVLTARGIYRKRKRYQGNAKLMNREKFYKKEKERRRNVKEYVGKPDVYTGEATGIRRDLIRSTKIH